MSSSSLQSSLKSSLRWTESSMSLRSRPLSPNYLRYRYYHWRWWPERERSNREICAMPSAAAWGRRCWPAGRAKSSNQADRKVATMPRGRRYRCSPKRLAPEANCRVSTAAQAAAAAWPEIGRLTAAAALAVEDAVDRQSMMNRSATSNTSQSKSL